MQPGELKQCSDLWKEVWDKPIAELFKYPVDWKALELPDYPRIIKKPMDLQTVKNKLNEGLYSNAFEFSEDLRLIWRNAKCYNRTNSNIHKNAESLDKNG